MKLINPSRMWGAKKVYIFFSTELLLIVLLGKRDFCFFSEGSQKTKLSQLIIWILGDNFNSYTGDCRDTFCCCSPFRTFIYNFLLSCFLFIITANVDFLSEIKCACSLSLSNVQWIFPVDCMVSPARTTFWLSLQIILFLLLKICYEMEFSEM